MITVYVDDGTKVSVPEWVTDIQAFRRWTDSDDFPREGNTWWLCGEVWVDMSKQQIFTHVLVKTAITSKCAKRPPGAIEAAANRFGWCA